MRIALVVNGLSLAVILGFLRYLDKFTTFDGVVVVALTVS